MSNRNIPERVFFNLSNFCVYRNYKKDRHQPERESSDRTTVLYDHACPICRAEMLRLKAVDHEDRLSLFDISAPDFKQEDWGVSHNEASRALHVLTAQGIWLVGMPAIRHVYAEVGLGWLMAPTGWPLVSRFADLAYRYFAPNRVVISRWLGMGKSEPCNDSVCDNGDSGRRIR